MLGYHKMRCAIWRGGTSKGVMFLPEDLPADPETRDRTILSVMGSPDPRQLNGIGGATPTTSKIAIVGRSRRPGADVDYTFGQVGIADARIDYGPNCGNVSAAVGPFAVASGLVDGVGTGVSTVRIFNTNTERVIESTFTVEDGQFVPDGPLAIPGVRGTGSLVSLRFLRPEGGVTGLLFPTGHLTDQVTLKDGRRFDVSVVDAGNLTVMVDGGNFDPGWDAPWLEDGLAFELGSTLETIRQQIGRRLGLYRPNEVVAPETHALPKITVIGPAMSYRSRKGCMISPSEMSLVARAVTMGRPHPAYPVTGATALAACARITGTVAERYASADQKDSSVRIGHPEGVSAADVAVSQVDGRWTTCDRQEPPWHLWRDMPGFLTLLRRSGDPTVSGAPPPRPSSVLIAPAVSTSTTVATGAFEGAYAPCRDVDGTGLA